ncbi:hypothetical protein SRB17_80680 [Streptomyces sp. RB17]|nr:hypothetical protein [Streptomyces sp. RB17]
MERTPEMGSKHTPPIGSARADADRSGNRALVWAQFAFSVLCVVGGTAISLMGNPPLGIAIVTVAAGWQITIHIRR